MGHDMATWITVCDTCKRENWAESGAEHTDGEVLAGLIEGIAANTDGVKTRRVSCMMGCTRACNVAVQGEGKLAYVLGTFEATSDDAQAIVDYASAYDASATGQVPYREWPQGVKGHFTSRTTPLPADD